MLVHRVKPNSAPWWIFLSFVFGLRKVSKPSLSSRFGGQVGSSRSATRRQKSASRKRRVLPTCTSGKSHGSARFPALQNQSPATSLLFVAASFFRRFRDARHGTSRFLTQNFLVDRGRSSSRLPVAASISSKSGPKLATGGNSPADPAEIGAQHVIRDDGSEAVSHDDDAVVMAALVQVMERVDRLHADRAAHRDIGRRARK